MKDPCGTLPDGILASIFDQLRAQGLDFESLSCCGDEGSAPRLVCVAANVRESLDEMGKSKRDQVVMVRVDEETARRLDAWVETGAMKSRSEAAALFIKEGLKVRATELSELEDSIRDVEKAKDRLRKRVREVLGEE
jgi:Arc/MetJ-type ribon-helix-helix transcriptional regulator